MPVTKTKILEGPSRAIFHFYFESDGVQGELDNYVLIDPTVDFNPEETSSLQYTIKEIYNAQVVYDSVLKFNALEPYPIWVISADAQSETCFKDFGGLKDRSTVQHDGKLLISTSGFAPAGSMGVLILDLKKN